MSASEFIILVSVDHARGQEGDAELVRAFVEKAIQTAVFMHDEFCPARTWEDEDGDTRSDCAICEAHWFGKPELKP